MHPAAAEELAELDEKEYRRVRRALQHLESDPFRARPGADVRKLKDLADGAALYRIRIGQGRAIYAAIHAAREVRVLLFDKRELGYARLTATAEARYG